MASDENVDDVRRTAHELVSQAEALLYVVRHDDLLPLWWPRGLPDVRPTFSELALKAGEAHAAIASGAYDEDLGARVGGPLGRPKRQLLRRLLVQVHELVDGQATGDAVQWIKTACGVASSALGSMSFIPGVGAIQEAHDLVRMGLDTVERLGHSGELPDRPPRRQ